MRNLASIALVVIAASAAGQAADDRHGAIAAAPDGSYGYSYDHSSRADAEAAARRECRSSRCQIKVWFRNNCGAYARGRGVEGWAYADSRAEAEEQALQECSARGSGCSILCWACNGH